MKRKFWITLFTGGVLIMTGCSQDEISGGENGINPDQSISDNEAYFGVRLVDTEAASGLTSRSTHKEYNDDYENFEWFNKGTADERAIIDNSECNGVLFFNSDYSYFGNGPLQKSSEVTLPENVYVAHKPADADQLIVPTYALIVLNSDPERLAQLDTELKAAGTDAVKKVLTYLNEVDTDNPESLAQYKGYFTMSSSLYLDKDNVLYALVPLNKKVFYKNVEEAVKEENLVHFKVERLLTKYTLIIGDGNRTFDQSGSIILPGTNTVKVRVNYIGDENGNKDVFSEWRINLVNWGVNGLEKNTYLFKNLVLNPSTYPWSVSQDFYSGWNSYVLGRSYWSIDENYNSGIYPDQYRVALNDQSVNSASLNTIYSEDYTASTGLKKDDYTLVYKPYNSFIDRTANKYSLENTFDASLLSGANLETKPYLRCGNHIIITAQFIIDELDGEIDTKNVDETGFIKGVTDKYMSNGMYWSHDALLEQAVATLLSNIFYNNTDFPIKNILTGNGSVPFINSDSKRLNLDNPLLDGEGNKITSSDYDKYFEFAPAFIKGGDGWVSIKLKDGQKLIANYEDGTKTELTKEQIVSYIYRFTNLAKHYKEGRMYYAIPIKHNLESVNFAQTPINKVSTGDFGAVRNSWYRLKVTSIQSPGTPVDDPEQPIIPNPESDDRSLGVEVQVLDWETVEINVGQLH